jgi:hypothetical protein
LRLFFAALAPAAPRCTCTALHLLLLLLLLLLRSPFF